MDEFLTIAFPWMDAAWIPVLAVILQKGQRIWAASFVAANMFMMRLMIDFMGEIGYPNGVLGFIETPLFVRGLWVYSLVYVFYTLLLYLLPTTSKGVFFIASSLSLFFIAATIFGGIMIL